MLDRRTSLVDLAYRMSGARTTCDRKAFDASPAHQALSMRAWHLDSLFLSALHFWDDNITVMASLLDPVEERSIAIKAEQPDQVRVVQNIVLSIRLIMDLRQGSKKIASQLKAEMPNAALTVSDVRNDVLENERQARPVR